LVQEIVGILPSVDGCIMFLIVIVIRSS